MSKIGPYHHAVFRALRKDKPLLAHEVLRRADLPRGFGTSEVAQLLSALCNRGEVIREFLPRGLNCYRRASEEIQPDAGKARRSRPSKDRVSYEIKNAFDVNAAKTVTLRKAPWE